MKFSVKFTCGKGSRVGILSNLKSNTENFYETPFSLDITKTGSVPHLTQDVYHDHFSTKSILCVPAQHFAKSVDVLQSYKKGAASFSALPSHPICLVVQDPSDFTRNGFNDKYSVSVWDNGSRERLSPQAYMQLVEAVKPDWYETLNDADTNSSSSNKRILKSKENSLKFLEQCLDIHRSKYTLDGVGVFAPLLGGHNIQDRRKMAEKILEKDGVDGYAILGLHTNGNSARELDPVVLKDCVQASLEGVPKDKIRQAQGAFSLMAILELVECGVDIFDSSSAYIATESGKGLCFPNTFQRILSYNPEGSTNPSSMNSPTTQSRLSTDTTTLSKKLKVESSDFGEEKNGIDEISSLNSDTSEGKKSSTLIDENEDFYEIDIIDKKYSESKEPLVADCKCFTCTTFTTAYIHHLLCVREMLANGLLMIHNLHHWNIFFETIREAIKTNRLEELKSFITQYSQRKC